MSEEHKALGYRPPPGSLASAAQAAVARHETQHADEHSLTVDQDRLRQAALADAQRIKEARGETTGSTSVDLNSIGEAEARKLMSDEHKALGHRPPPGSLASEAQSAAAKHPDAHSGVDPATLARAALEDASRIAHKNPADLKVEQVGEGMSS